jgi:hypothetical protein
MSVHKSVLKNVGVWLLFQTFAAVGEFGSVVEQQLMTFGKNVTSELF